MTDQAEDADEQPYDPKTFPLRPNVRFPMKGMNNPVAALRDEKGLRNVMLGYYGAITGIDEQFARLLKALDDRVTVEPVRLACPQGAAWPW